MSALRPIGMRPRSACPDSVKDLLLRRLRGLGDDCRQALSVAAVAGREFELDVLEACPRAPTRSPHRPHRGGDRRRCPGRACAVGGAAQLLPRALSRDDLRAAFGHPQGRDPRPDRGGDRGGAHGPSRRARRHARLPLPCRRRAAQGIRLLPPCRHGRGTGPRPGDGAREPGRSDRGGRDARYDCCRRGVDPRPLPCARMDAAAPRRARQGTGRPRARAGGRASGGRPRERDARCSTLWGCIGTCATRRPRDAVTKRAGDRRGARRRTGPGQRAQPPFARARQRAGVRRGGRAGRARARDRPPRPATSSPSAARWTASSSPRCSSATSSAWRSSARSSSAPNASAATCGTCNGRCASPATCRWSAATGRRPSDRSQRRSPSASASGDPSTGVLIRDASSWIARCRGDYARSLAFGREAVTRADAADADWLGWAAAGLATSLLDLRAAEEAIAVLERGLAAAERNRARGQTFRCLGALSSAMRMAGADPQARALAERAQQIARAGHHAARQSRLLGRAGLPRDRRDPARGRGRGARRGGNAGHGCEAWERSGARQVDRNDRPLLGELRRGARRLGVGGADARPAAPRRPATRGYSAERWQIEAGLARVATAADRLEEAEDRSRRARELIDTMAASVGDEELGARFRERALAEIAHPGPTLGH